LAACQRKRLRFLRFSFTQRTQPKRLRFNGNRASGSMDVVCRVDNNIIALRRVRCISLWYIRVLRAGRLLPLPVCIKEYGHVPRSVIISLRNTQLVDVGENECCSKYIIEIRVYDAKSQHDIKYYYWLCDVFQIKPSFHYPSSLPVNSGSGSRALEAFCRVLNS